MIALTFVAEDKPAHPRVVASIVKRAVERVGLDPAVFSSHSSRRSLATEATAHSAPAGTIMRQAKHRSAAAFVGYVEEGAAVVEDVGRYQLL
ncbi:hypothetical protein [Azospirillum sp. B2RO_4]|uniref:hypothetical protein n=1 Tax=Azospirillum sp. B2RO_4 TaxID=3027796 RepID=UPI003DA85A76